MSRDGFFLVFLERCAFQRCGEKRLKLHTEAMNLYIPRS